MCCIEASSIRHSVERVYLGIPSNFFEASWEASRKRFLIRHFAKLCKSVWESASDPIYQENRFFPNLKKACIRMQLMIECHVSHMM